MASGSVHTVRDAMGLARRYFALVMPGREERCSLALTAVLAGGHVLIDDVSGIGRSTLARAVAAVCGGGSRHVVFSHDLLPSDLTGHLLYSRASDDLHLRRGPIFTDVLVISHLNRTMPKTHTALLEAMATRAVSIDGRTHRLSDRFTVVAIRDRFDEDDGMLSLPHALLDRFMVSVTLGYPPQEVEAEALAAGPSRGDADGPTLDLVGLRRIVRDVRVDRTVSEYTVRALSALRESRDVIVGPSVRAGHQLIDFSRAVAAASGREFVVPEDVLRSAGLALAHSIMLTAEAELSGITSHRLVEEVFSAQ